MEAAGKEEAGRRSGVLIVHGGASDVPQHLWHSKLEGVKEAACRGHEVLSEGGTAVEAVEAAVMVLEDDPIFNAGKGSALTLDREVEMDASVMSGEGLKSGAVAAIRNVQNPIKVAHLVMEKTPHVILAGEGANQFAAALGHPQVPPDTLVTQLAKQNLETYKKFSTSVDPLFNVLQVQKKQSCHDTVGCAALDSYGHTACATSTGGIIGKMPGRVGGTPMPGAGGYADDQVGAVCTTGHGESIMRVCLARHIIDSMATGVPVSASIQQSLNYMAEHVEGCGGAVAVSRDGVVGMGFSTPCMPWAYVKDRYVHYGIQPGQHMKAEY